MSVVLTHVTRGGEIESVHRGNLVVVDRSGRIVYSAGDASGYTYWRSAAKPFQVLPMIEAGGVERFGFSEEEIAVMTSSHGGEERHIDAVGRIFKKMGCGIDKLDCGAAKPMHPAAARKLLQQNMPYEQVHNPCSGKHSSMIALALIRGYVVDGYVQPEHPVQKEMLDVVKDVSGIEIESIKIGIDGCGVPVFGLPVYNMAKAYSLLADPETAGGSKRRDALKTVASAMSKNPFYVAGTGRLDTELIEVTNGRIIAKLGSEGVYCAAVTGAGLGIAIKIEDGNYRAIDPVIVELLRRLGLLTGEELEKLADRWVVKIKNHHKDVIGEIKAVF
ncbi:MAG: L-asparaginase II [Firmicutes bacterium]|nr:L-asparaginase II [Bacillota bacterium]MDI6706489.1 asparaginase [Bacillota bacterium]